jgi:hypothetical protein
MKEKNKNGGLGRGRPLPYLAGAVPHSVKMYWALIFWPLYPLVRRAVAMP